MRMGMPIRMGAGTMVEGVFEASVAATGPT